MGYSTKTAADTKKSPFKEAYRMWKLYRGRNKGVFDSLLAASVGFENCVEANGLIDSRELEVARLGAEKAEAELAELIALRDSLRRHNNGY
jgi:hypothetical protein